MSSNSVMQKIWFRNHYFCC